MRNPGQSAHSHARRLGAIIFLYGFVANLLFLRLYVYWANSPSRRGGLNGLGTQAAFAVISGLCFCGLMLTALRRPRGVAHRGANLLARGALYGSVATAVAVELIALGLAGYVAYPAFRATGSDPKILLAGFITGAIGWQVNAIPELVLGVPFAALYGGVGAICVRLLHHSRVQ